MERLTKRVGYRSEAAPLEDMDDVLALQRVIDRLAAYEDAEEQGLLVRLPCKVGDTVYKHWKVGGKTEIGSALVTGFEIANDGINYCYRVKRFDRKETIKKFGKTVFLTRAEAEETRQGGTA